MRFKLRVATFVAVVAVSGFAIFNYVNTNSLKSKAADEGIADGNIKVVCATGTAGQNGCNYIGGDGVQKAVDEGIASDEAHTLNLIIKAGTYTRATPSIYSNPVGIKRKCFVDTKGKFISFKGENGAILDGGGKANPMSGICASSGSIYVLNMVLQNFKDSDVANSSPDSQCWSAKKESEPCSTGDAISAEDKTFVSVTDSILQHVDRYGVMLADTATGRVIHNQIIDSFEGVTFFYRTKAIIEDNIFSQHTHHIALTGFSSAFINKNIFKDGRSDAEGIFTLNNSIALLYNNTFVKNPVAVHGYDDSQLTMVNNIFAFNTSSEHPSGLLCSGKAILVKYAYNDMFSNGGGDAGISGSNYDFSKCLIPYQQMSKTNGNLTVDPRFVNKDAGDYRLTPDTPQPRGPLSVRPTVVETTIAAPSPLFHNGDPSILEADGSRSTIGSYGGVRCSDSSNDFCAANNIFTIPNELKVTFKLRFQGITRKPAGTMPVKIRINRPGYENVQTVTLTSDDQGTWTGTGTFNLPASNSYTVYIKGPRHIQKKICENVPKETTPGSYRCTTGQVNLVSGDNTLDFTNIYQLVGDVPADNGQQDGIVDSYDISFVQNHLGSSEPADLSRGDLNMDGVIDTQDYSLLIKALSIKFDE